MDKKTLMRKTEAWRVDIVEMLLSYVRECGEDCGDYERNEFGLDCDEDETHRVTKVLNLFDNGGCYFFEADKVNDDSLRDMDDGNWSDRLYEHTVHTAYQCLYIVEDDEGGECLHYYRFTNGGVRWDDDQSEPDHGYALTLNFIDLHYLLQAININF